MRSFTDKNGKQWLVDITWLTVERVRAACGIDMPGLFDPQLDNYGKLLGDELKLIEVVYECCRSSAEKDGLTLDDLKATWQGEIADAAQEAWKEALIDFFRDPARRAALRTMLKTIEEVGEKVIERGTAELTTAASEPAFDAVWKLLKSGLANGSNAASGSTPATSDSIPAPSPSDNST
jgi:hypothetical protein